MPCDQSQYSKRAERWKEWKMRGVYTHEIWPRSQIEERGKSCLAIGVNMAKDGQVERQEGCCMTGAIAACRRLRE